MDKVKTNKAIFLDRDGTLNMDEGYTYKTQELRFFPDVFRALNLLKNDFIFIIITNQAGIGRGYYTEEDMHKFNERLLDELSKEKIKVEGVYFCPHTPEDNCSCRKPNPSSINKAKQKYGIDVKSSWVIGDHPNDVLLAKNAGCRSVYVLTGHGKKHFDELKDRPDFIAENLLRAAEHIVKNS